MFKCYQHFKIIKFEVIIGVTEGLQSYTDSFILYNIVFIRGMQCPCFSIIKQRQLYSAKSFFQFVLIFCYLMLITSSSEDS